MIKGLIKPVSSVYKFIFFLRLYTSLAGFSITSQIPQMTMIARYMVFILFVLSATWVQAQTNPLHIPPTLEGPTYNLTMHRTTHTFMDGVETNTYAFNESYLGPTLIMNEGEDIQINVTNRIGEPTTVHWHGMHVSPANDGGPHTSFDEGETWSPAFTVLDKATTFWYHPHLHHKTNEHVYKGLAGMIIIRDDEEALLDLPRTYGVDDIPLILQDRQFDRRGQLIFNEGGTGAGGNELVINGTLDPHLDVPAQVVRFRVLNGSGARVYNVGINDNRMFQQIGSDGGLLSAPVTLNRIRLAPGERAEFLVDLGGDENQTLELVTYASELNRGEPGGTGGGMGNNPLDGTDTSFLTLRVGATGSSPVTSIPNALVTVTRIAEEEAVRTRPIRFDGGGGGGQGGPSPFTINGVSMDLTVINEVVNLDDTEIWELTNETNTPHPFHIHDIQFYILDRNGQLPPLNEQGRKDVVMVYPDETVRFITTFDDFADPDIPYMYHCHFLGHEDAGMMGQFIVVDNTNISVEEETPRQRTISTGSYPNPFTDQTRFSYTLPQRSDIRIDVFNVLGQRVKTIFNGTRDAGTYELIWKSGHLPSGTYLVQLMTPYERATHTVLLHRSN